MRRYRGQLRSAAWWRDWEWIHKFRRDNSDDDDFSLWVTKMATSAMIATNRPYFPEVG